MRGKLSICFPILLVLVISTSGCIDNGPWYDGFSVWVDPEFRSINLTNFSIPQDDQANLTMSMTIILQSSTDKQKEMMIPFHFNQSSKLFEIEENKWYGIGSPIVDNQGTFNVTIRFNLNNNTDKINLYLNTSDISLFMVIHDVGDIEFSSDYPEDDNVEIITIYLYKYVIVIDGIKIHVGIGCCDYA